MHKIDKIQLSYLSLQTGFIRDTLEKVIRLERILTFLNTDSSLRGRLALKGGTAINMIFFDLPRLSVDIDLDYLIPETRSKMLESRAAINSVILNYMEQQGYTLSPRTKTPYSLDSWVFRYVNAGGTIDAIKIEINYSLRAHILPPQSYPLTPAFLEGGSQILILDSIEIFGSKINALLSRAAARDLFDVHNLITNTMIDETQRPMLRKAIVFYAAISSKAITQQISLDSINAITRQEVKTALTPLLPRSRFFDLEEAKFIVIEYLKDLLELTPSEQEFLTLFQHRSYQPQLLFDDPAIIERIAAHPMALWKTRG